MGTGQGEGQSNTGWRKNVRAGREYRLGAVAVENVIPSYGIIAALIIHAVTCCHGTPAIMPTRRMPDEQ